jgi:quinoprotein dehydrogenase-associated probable ABC transporter substrate-binding protein
MCSRFPRRAAAALVALLATAASAAELRVCADPDNMPYSDTRGLGFENRIAALVAAEMGMALRYEWMPLRRGFVRKTLGANLCDVLIGVPAGFDRVLTTRPYYRSAYVFVHRRDQPARGFDDPRLRSMRLGVQLIGNDLAATPPGLALAEHGAVENVTGFTIYGEGPAAERMVEAIEHGSLDGCLAWGPQVAYFARRADPPLEVTLLTAPAGMEAIPFTYPISMGVRKADGALRDRLDRALERRHADIEAILDSYAVPRLAGGTP